MLTIIKPWLPALACLCCQALGIGLVSLYGFFVSPLAQEFNASVTAINSGMVVLLLTSAVAAPIAGKLADQVAVRYLMLFGVILGMASLWFVSLSSSLAMAALGFAGFAFGLSFYGVVTINTFLVRCYRQRAGRALAIAATGVSVGSMLLPLGLEWLLERMDWRGSLAYLAGSIALFLAVVIVLYIPAGKSTDGAQHALASPGRLAGSRLLLQRPFWLVGIAVALSFTVSMILAICYPSHFATLGMTNVDVAQIFFVSGGTGLIGKVALALYVDRMRKWTKSVAIGLLAMQLVGGLLLLWATDFWSALPAVMLLGCGAGAMIALHPFINSQYFHNSVLGSVNGGQAPMLLPLCLLGAPLAGYAFDVSGSYLPALQGIVVALFCSMLLFMSLPAMQGRCQLTGEVPG